MIDDYQMLLGFGAVAVSLHMTTNLISYPVVRKYISEFEKASGRAAALQKAGEFLRSANNPISKILYVGDRRALKEYLNMRPL